MKKRLSKRKRVWRLTKLVVYRETALDFPNQLWSFIGAFVGIGLIAYLQSIQFSRVENVFLIGSFGASSVLIYGAVNSPLAQPRNLIGGHVISALIGVICYKCLPDVLWVNAPMAVALAIVAMQVTKTLHPPGGATALIAVIGSGKIKALGFWYVWNPVLTGALILLVVALICNNMTKGRRYPSLRS